MYYGEIKNCDVANGEGVRVTLFVSGCTNRCKNCFQPQTWDFAYGQPFTADTEQKLLEMLEPSYIRGLTVLGGEPFEPENQKTLVSLLKRIRQEMPTKNIWCYSGYTFEELIGKQKSRAFTDTTLDMLSLIDTLVDGEFIEELKDISLKFRGSSNQRIIDVKESLKSNSDPLE